MRDKPPDLVPLSDRIEAALRLAILVPAPIKSMMVELAQRLEAAELELRERANRPDPISGLALSEGELPWLKNPK